MCGLPKPLSQYLFIDDLYTQATLTSKHEVHEPVYIFYYYVIQPLNTGSIRKDRCFRQARLNYFSFTYTADTDRHLPRCWTQQGKHRPVPIHSQTTSAHPRNNTASLKARVPLSVAAVHFWGRHVLLLLLSDTITV